CLRRYSLIIVHSPVPPLFPYTTLFRSKSTCPTRTPASPSASTATSATRRWGWCAASARTATPTRSTPPCAAWHRPATEPRSPFRSEEHTSELQSRENLVCRLLLEKK